MLARNKLNSFENLISQALTNFEISHKDFMTIVNKEKNYRELKDSIRIRKSHGSDTEKNDLIEEGNKIAIDKIIKHNLKSQV